MSWVPLPWDRRMKTMSSTEGDFYVPSVKDTPVLVRDLTSSSFHQYSY